jgi:hypothetical protein
MSAASSVPGIQMISATTTDSKSVTIRFQVNQAPGAADPIQLGIYRSRDGRFDASDSLVDVITLQAPGSSLGRASTSFDESGHPATAPGMHTLTVPLDQGLPPFPEKPYVLVVADPGSPSATTHPDQTASFRVYTIGIVTHGGIQNSSWTHGPPWQIETAYMMRHEGFDSVIAYNWVQQSSTPGEAIKQSPRLARMIVQVARKFPASAPVDLEFIGHSEGTVVNTYAIVALERAMPAQLDSGYIEDILLDPHAANNHLPGQQMSFSGALGAIARPIVHNYQAKANDPPAFIPSVVDDARVFFQHSRSTAGGIYNLWGQVPVKSDGAPVHYYNLTGMGATHSGKTGVNYWFRNVIAPTLGDQAPMITKLQLDGQIDNARSFLSPAQSPGISQASAGSARADRAGGPALVVQTDSPVFSGTAAPNSIVRLGLSPATEPMKLTLAGVTMASRTGQWSLSPQHPLKDGQYRTLISAFSPSLTTRKGLAIIPTQPLGRLVVDATPGP